MSVFGDAEFVKKVKEGFVCVAVNQHHHRRRKDVEYDLFEKLIEQTGEKVSGYNQGLYFFTPAAELLSFSNTVSGEQAWKLLRQASEKFEPTESLPAVLKGHEDAGPLWKLPDGSQLVLVNSNVLGGYEKSENPPRQIHQDSLGRDHLYLSRDEISLLAAGKFPDSLKNRMPALLNDNTRGEPDRWHGSEIKQLDLTLQDGRITGQLHFENAAGARGYKATLLGFVKANEGALTRFDIVVSGNYWGEGRYTRNGPKGMFPFAVAFRLSDGTEPYDIPPPGVK
ncbi:MAG: hypothetical protein ACI9G1_005759 [Pirellulaceae bacterium]